MIGAFSRLIAAAVLTHQSRSADVRVTRLSALLPVLITALALVPTGPAAAGSSAPPPAPCAGESGYLIRDVNGDQTDAAGATAPANMDVEGVYFNWDSSSSTLTANIQVAHLDETQPSPAESTTGNQYYLWYVWNGQLKFVEAVADSSGTSFAYGSGDRSTGNWANDGATTGAFHDGDHGVISIVVPAAAGGSAGQKFGDVAAVSGYAYGSSDTTELFFDVDQAPDGGDPFAGASGVSYTVEDCTADAAAGQQNAGAPGPAPAGPEATGASSPRFDNVSPSLQYETKDILARQNAGEPSLGTDWKTGNAMYMAGTQVSRVTFDDSVSPAKATWTDVTPPQQSLVNEDAILFTDHQTGRTLAEGLLVAGANGTYTDDDGATWQQTQGFPEPHGPDHETVGAGPYADPKPATASADGYPNAWYYCSQNVLTLAGAFCGRSDTGGKTWDPSTQLLGTAFSPCGSIHGHVKVAPDGSVYVPQNTCTRKDGEAGQGMAVSRDNGASWTYSVVPDSRAEPTASGSDPSIGIGSGNSVYFGYEDGGGSPKIAVSHDHGTTWEPSVDVGAPLGIRNTKFPEVVAGDDNRAAFAWLGTTTPGDDQAADFKGVWYLYVSFTYDGGKTWTTVEANPGDVIQRGCIWNGGGGNPCRNLLDFNDATVDKQGRVLVAYTDGCADYPYSYQSDTGEAEGMSPHGPSKCESDPSAYADTDKVSLDGLVRQSCGEGLFAAYDGQIPSCSTGGTTSSTPQATPSGTTAATSDSAATTPAAPSSAAESAGQSQSGTPGTRPNAPAGAVLGVHSRSISVAARCKRQARHVHGRAKRRRAYSRCVAHYRRIARRRAHG